MSLWARWPPTAVRQATLSSDPPQESVDATADGPAWPQLVRVSIYTVVQTAAFMMFGMFIYSGGKVCTI